MGNPNWKDKWPSADLEALVFKREVEKKTFGQIADELNQHENSCARRYRQIVAAREPAPSIVPEPKPQCVPLHRQMGIETYTHMQAILSDPNGLRGKRNFPHWYRMPVTLAKVFA